MPNIEIHQILGDSGVFDTIRSLYQIKRRTMIRERNGGSPI